MKTTVDSDRSRKSQILAERLGTFEGSMTQEELRRMREEDGPDFDGRLIHERKAKEGDLTLSDQENRSLRSARE